MEEEAQKLWKKSSSERFTSLILELSFLEGLLSDSSHVQAMFESKTRNWVHAFTCSFYLLSLVEQSWSTFTLKDLYWHTMVIYYNFNMCDASLMKLSTVWKSVFLVCDRNVHWDSFLLFKRIALVVLSSNIILSFVRFKTYVMLHTFISPEEFAERHGMFICEIRFLILVWTMMISLRKLLKILCILGAVRQFSKYSCLWIINKIQINELIFMLFHINPVIYSNPLSI